MKRPFQGEQVIPLKRVMSLPQMFCRPTYRAVHHWHKFGVKGIRLEVARQGRHVFTSIEAVERFLEAVDAEARKGNGKRK